MIVLTVGLLVVSHLLFFIIVPRVAKSNGIEKRYFERSLSYKGVCDGTVEDQRVAAHTEPICLRAFAELDRERAARYVVPVLFPLDLIMMSFLAAFLAVGSVTFGARVFAGVGQIRLLIALPLLYFLADLMEDMLLGWLLTVPSAVLPARVNFLKFLTTAKFVALLLAYLECGALAILAAHSWSRKV